MAPRGLRECVRRVAASFKSLTVIHALLEQLGHALATQLLPLAVFLSVRVGAVGGRSTEQGTQARVKHLQECAEAYIYILR